MPMVCPQCEAEFREGFSECSDCHVPLVSKLAQGKIAASMAQPEKLVTALQARYADVYKVAGSLVQIGQILKVVAGISFLLLGGLGIYLLGQGRSSWEAGLGSLLAGISSGVCTLIAGIVIAAIGQLARCIAD